MLPYFNEIFDGVSKVCIVMFLTVKKNKKGLIVLIFLLKSLPKLKLETGKIDT